jgi:inhibitor of cysteine peptidase
MRHLLFLATFFAFSYTGAFAATTKSCIQVIQPAINTTTGVCKEFSTPCDVPATGWKTVYSCSSEINTELEEEIEVPTTPSFEYQTFASCSEFEGVMKKILPTTSSPGYYRGGPMVMLESVSSVPSTSKSEVANDAVAGSVSPVAPEPFSETNAQVLGVDEADTVKTDGKYLYTYQEMERAIIILDAKTLERKKTIKIPTSYYGVTFYLTKTKLVLTATKSASYNARWYGWYNNEQKSIIALYDIADPTKASLLRIIQVDGNLSDSRIADNGLMTAVVSTSFSVPPIYAYSLWESNKMPAYEYTSRTLIPRISDVTLTKSNGYKSQTRSIADCSRMGSILPDTASLENFSFSPTLTSIVRFDASVAAWEITSQVVLSEAGQIHLSRNSIYLTSHMFQSSGGSKSSCPPNAKCAMPLIWRPSENSTLVHRFAFEGVNTKYVYSRTIAGTPLSQYSMDEDENKNFRIVTSEQADERSTRVSILDQKWALLGSLTNLAPGENFQSSRFIGNRLYLVTFEQIDPLFVIDLSQPKAPKVLGELKIPGYSTYLHPYDANRLIGIGYDTKVNEWGGTQNAGLKVDLYNVADVKNPKQEQSLTIGDAGSSSEVLTNPRAFVWYKEKNLLLMPATVMVSANDEADSYRSKSGFQGILGISIFPSAISEKFRVSNISLASTLEADWRADCAQYTNKWTKPVCRKLLDGSEYCTSTSSYVPPYCFADSTVDTYFASQIWNYYDDFVSRALYVGEKFYSISNSKIRLWDFANTKTPVAEVKFSSASVNYPTPVY